MSPAVWSQIPNALTLLRLVLAGLFFAALNLWWYDPDYADYTGAIWANVAIVMFVLAAVSDAVDGYLARKWQVESVFGRIMDPVCDKVLVLGAFVYLAGPRFLMPEKAAGGSAFAMASGVYPWMVVVIIFRELAVTGIRSVAEAMGAKFGSSWWGKWKMILQTVAIPAVILIAANFDPGAKENIAARIIRDVLVWATLLVTVGSGVPYVIDCIRVMRTPRASDAAEGAQAVVSTDRHSDGTPPG